MAYCPKCKGEIPANAVLCPHCGYDFPAGARSPVRSGFLYGSIANVALVVGQVVAGLTAIGGGITCVMAFVSGQWAEGLLRGPVAVILCLAMMVVFGRARDLS